MYRNIIYDNRSRSIKLWTWDAEGNRIEDQIPYKPHLYFEHKNGTDGTSIFKTPLKKREFNTNYDRRKFVETSGMDRLFNNLPIEQQFLIEKYGDLKDQSAFTENPLCIFYLDIEVFSPNEFPTADEAKHPVNLITVYDSLNDHYHTWGERDYTPSKENVTYYKCASESLLFRSFMKFWTNNYPDIVTGWNTDGFDIPYIVNRLGSLFGDDYSDKLSPTGKIWSKEKLDRFGNPITEWVIQGLTSIDYLKAYKKFSRNERESYTLDYIGEYEGVGNKIEFEGTLAQLSLADWKTFTDYNIRDVELVAKLESKLHFIDLCRMIAYKGLTKFEKALETNAVVAGAFALEARKVGKIIPTFQYERTGNPPGGLVRYPENGFNDDIVSFDAASLYPNTIISLNLSPETKVGQCVVDDNFTYVTSVRGKEFRVPNSQFKGWMIKNKICKSMHGTLFSQVEKGIIPNIIENIYADRKTSKAKGQKLERKANRLKKDDPQRKILEIEGAELDVYQYTLKILMNSLYGTFGNQYSVLYDLDLVGSITLTGQESNLQSSLAVKEFVKKKYKCTKDLMIYGDTDSIYITLRPLFDQLGITLTKSEERIEGKPMEITKEAMKIIEELGGETNPYNGAITKHLAKWAKAEMNSLDPRFEFKREKISKRGIFLKAKKRYIIQVIDNEGMPIDVGSKKEFYYTGGEIVSATHAKELQNIIKQVINTMIISKDIQTSNDSIMDGYGVFCKLTPEVLSKRQAIKDLKKYEKNANGFQIGKGTTQNAKASLLYNNLLDHLTINDKYEKIRSGDKVKILYVGKNKFGIDYVGFKDKLPIEFGMEPDYRKLYLKNVHVAIERIYNAVGWSIINPTKNHTCDILEEFS